MLKEKRSSFYCSFFVDFNYVLIFYFNYKKSYKFTNAYKIEIVLINVTAKIISMKLFRLALASFCSILTLSSSATDKIVNCTHSNFCINNTSTDVLYSCILDNISGNDISVVVHFGDGTSFTHSNLTTQSFNGNHIYELAGIYSVLYEVQKAGKTISTYRQKVNTSCTFVNLSVFYDTDNSGDQSSTEALIGGLFEIYKDGVLDNGVWTTEKAAVYPVEVGSTYKFVIKELPFSALKPYQGVSEKTVYVSSTFKTTDVSFGVNCPNGAPKDLSVKHSGARFALLKQSYISGWAYNNTCIPENGVVTMYFDNRFKLKSVQPTPVSSTTNSITWDVKSLALFKNQGIYGYLDPINLATIQLGDKVVSRLVIGPNTGDINTGNNISEDTTIVVSSYDPNEIQVSPGGYITAGKKLEYTIFFENLGNDTAYDIHILDTLAAQHYDMSSLSVLESSHPVSAGIVDGMNNESILRFQFDDIKLPDSSNKLLNKGYVKYSIYTKETLPPNTVINNRAGIYFDINPVVMTNTVQNIVAPLGISTANTESLIKAYPNPAGDMLYIQSTTDAYTHAVLMNSVGQTVLKTDVKKGTNTISTKQLAPGIYHLLLQGTEGTKAIKIEKQ